MFSPKLYIYGVATVLILTVISSSLYTWHYKPLASLSTQADNLQTQLNIVGNRLNICEANLSKQKLQGFIDGIGGNDEGNYSDTIDFSNIVY